MKNIVVLGATGLVGGAIVDALARDGHTVLAVGRNQDAIARITARAPAIRTLRGDVGSDEGAERTAGAALDALGHVDLVVASLNPPRATLRISERPTAELAEYLEASLLTHVRAAKAFVPRIAPGGAHVAVGGAASDFVWPEHGHISVNGAAQRMLFRVLAHEYQARPVALREYVISAVVHDGTGTQGVSAATIGDDFARLAALPGFGPEAVTRFPARGA
jgi:NAD(P)-dependent dehydrogenase (short-subunit alcohol dehydrogenase family)